MIHTFGEVDNLFEKLKLKFSNDIIDFIKKSKSKNFDDRYSVFKKKDNDDNWKTELHPMIIDYIINDLSGTSFNKYL